MIPSEFIQISVLLFGKDFSPNAFKMESGLAFGKCLEPGGLSRSGRTVEFGSASIDLPMGSSPDSAETLRVLEGIKERLMKFTGPGKVAEIVVHVTARYKDQCNLEFPLAFLKSISDLGANLTLTCSPIPSRQADQRPHTTAPARRFRSPPRVSGTRRGKGEG